MISTIQKAPAALIEHAVDDRDYLTLVISLRYSAPAAPRSVSRPKHNK